MAFVTSEITATPPYALTATKLFANATRGKITGVRQPRFRISGNGRYELKEQNDDNRN